MNNWTCNFIFTFMMHMQWSRSKPSNRSTIRYLLYTRSSITIISSSSSSKPAKKQFGYGKLLFENFFNTGTKFEYVAISFRKATLHLNKARFALSRKCRLTIKLILCSNRQRVESRRWEDEKKKQNKMNLFITKRVWREIVNFFFFCSNNNISALKINSLNSLRNGSESEMEETRI
jgi:hypothetical protein